MIRINLYIFCNVALTIRNAHIRKKDIRHLKHSSLSVKQGFRYDEERTIFLPQIACAELICMFTWESPRNVPARTNKAPRIWRHPCTTLLLSILSWEDHVLCLWRVRIDSTRNSWYWKLKNSCYIIEKGKLRFLS